MTYKMAAEVGLLTRNIKIIGDVYPTQQTDAFGARVLVGTYEDERLYIGRYLYHYSSYHSSAKQENDK
jgi:TRAP-type mannitol/chloroaromatic compound transport system substrate-binding protein